MGKIYLVLLLISATFVSFAVHAQTDQRIENLRSFAKIYGYVKYFHPSDEAANLDWDRFAIYGVQRVASADDQKELIEILNDLFLPIAPSIVIHDQAEEVGMDLSKIIPEDTTTYKHITWQHYGLGKGDKSLQRSEYNLYNSSRINREIAQKAELNSWGSLVNQFDAKPYQGMEFKVEAYVKTNITSENDGVHLWFRVDRRNGATGSFENMQNKPINAATWDRYAITGKFDKDASLMNMGVFMRGKGKAWVDEYQLKVKERDDWKLVKYEDFETFPEHDLSKQWQVGIGKGSAGISELHSFFASTEDAHKGEYSLQIEGVDQSANLSPRKLFDDYPKPGEFISEEVGNNLQVIIPIALFGSESQTFPSGNEEDLARLMKVIEKGISGQDSGSQLQVRWADIIISWNIFKHFYPYFDVVDVDWDAVFTEALKEAGQDKNEFDFLLTLRKFLAKLKDGHVSVFLDGDTTNNYYLPLEWEWVENQLILTNVMDADLSLKVGEIVLEIDGASPRAYFDEAEKYISAANAGSMRYKASIHTISGPKGSSVQLKLKNLKDHVRMESVSRSKSRRMYRYASKTMNKAKHEDLSDGIYYLNLDLISMSEIEDLLPKLEAAEGIICDLRGYPNNNHDFISYLLNENDTSTRWMQVPQIIYPDNRHLGGYDHSGFGLKAKEPHLDAKIVFVINGSAISYAESYMSFIEHYYLATIVGEPTAGTNGNVNSFDLPGGYHIRWTGMKVVKHDGSQHHGIGIIPDVPVFKTIRGIREGRDEYLEKAIEIIKGE